jgi:RHS repeat-associated protein
LNNEVRYNNSIAPAKRIFDRGYTYDDAGNRTSQINNLASTTSYYLPNIQGSTRVLTSNAAAITDTYRYSAFGDIETQTGTTLNSYLYTRQQFDSSTGLYSLRTRYYDAAVGRFLSRDTYPLNHQNPMELNRYVYAAGNPVRWSDPSGLISYALNLSAVMRSKVTIGVTIGGLAVALWSQICRMFRCFEQWLRDNRNSDNDRLPVPLPITIQPPTTTPPTGTPTGTPTDTPTGTPTPTPSPTPSDTPQVIVELGAGDYTNAILMKQLFPDSRVIATNLRSEWDEGRLFSSVGHSPDEYPQVRLYQGWAVAKLAGVEVGETSSIENGEVTPDHIADLVYTILPYPRSAWSFGVQAARIASTNSGTIIAVTGGGSGSADMFEAGFNSSRPGSIFINFDGFPFGKPGDWGEEGFRTKIYAVP